MWFSKEGKNQISTEEVNRLTGKVIIKIEVHELCDLFDTRQWNMVFPILSIRPLNPRNYFCEENTITILSTHVSRRTIDQLLQELSVKKTRKRDGLLYGPNGPIVQHGCTYRIEAAKWTEMNISRGVLQLHLVSTWITNLQGTTYTPPLQTAECVPALADTAPWRCWVPAASRTHRSLLPAGVGRAWGSRWQGWGDQQAAGAGPIHFRHSRSTNTQRSSCTAREPAYTCPPTTSDTR